MNNNSIYSNTGFKISIESLNENIEVLKEWNDFVIEKKGIYTLEGENQSGKSLLIKMIMGVLPPKAKETNTKNALINNQTVNITSVIDARNFGLQAVFQDDELIPTMTIKEQIELKYLNKRNFKNYWCFICNYIFHLLFEKIGILKENESFSNFINKATCDVENVFPEKKLLKKAKKLIELFGLDIDVLSKYPNQLSGGTIARIRIAVTFLLNDLKILFLDEALNAIDKESKFEIIDIIKNIVKERNITIVVVTHNQQEIYRWQPIGRYRINDKMIEYEGSKFIDGIETSVNLPKRFIKKFDSLYNSKEYFKVTKELREPYIVIIDENVVNNPATKTLFHYLKVNPKNDNCFIISIDENNKTIDKYKEIIIDILFKYPKSGGTFFLVGGGVLINLGLFICGTINRGIVDYIIVPTTIMAISDVAIGSKASLNVNTKSIHPKHKIGLYSNPLAVVSDIGYVETLSFEIIKIGLSESLKHGILQNKVLFNDTIDLLQKENVNSIIQSAYEISLNTRDLKGKCLVIDPFEKQYSRILLFGHLHAHSIESLSHFEIPHGVSVYFGIMLDVLLSNNEALFNKISFILNDKDLIKWFRSIKEYILNNLDNLEDVYNSDVKMQHYKSPSIFNIIKLDYIAQYKNIGAELNIIEVGWQEIEKSIKILIDKIK